uniref:Uncharacterized protein n=1 Tax=Cannabis sativa TaxID=3483 RepID=A0A803QTY4_CANSA
MRLSETMVVMLSMNTASWGVHPLYASEVVNEAVEKCTKACFAICTKGRSITATTTPVEIA